MTAACTDGIDTGFVALGYLKVAILGVVQGITELLPISSTAHMRIVPALLGWQDPGSAFSAVMQLAALTAILSYFWSDVRNLLRGTAQGLIQRDLRRPELRLFLGMIVATIPIGIAGLLLSKTLNACDSPFRSLTVIGIASIMMGLLLAIAELAGLRRRDICQVKLPDALLIGLAQVGALIPGVSRSGSTLTAALLLDLKREDAARYSFLLGLPAIALAGFKELHALYQVHLGAEGWSILAVGLVVGAISAFGAIWGLMRIMEGFSSWPFVIYRIVIGALILSLIYFEVLA
jgi:undecaprenyl-diphosphatase